VLIPCIDLQDGQAVQLVHGRKRELAVADVFGLLRKFKRYPWLHVIDLDAAMGKGRTTNSCRELCASARKDFGMKVRVGGGIRTVSRAEEIAGWGASQVIVGSAAFRKGEVNSEFLRRLTKKSSSKTNHHRSRHCPGKHHHSRLAHAHRASGRKSDDATRTFCVGFLCTDVDREGTMTGANLEWFRRLRSATPHPIIAAGGIKTRGRSPH